MTTPAGQLEFFTNSIDTRTTGVDLVLDYKNIDVGGTLAFSVAGNVNLKNEREGGIPQVKGTDVIDATQEALFFTSRPKQKFVLTAVYQLDKWILSLNNTYFGKTEFRQNGLDLHLKTVFDPKVVTDFALGYDLFDNVNLTANVNNVFDVIPKWNFEALDTTGQAILKDPAQTKVQTNLITFNGRYPITTYDGAHFSQLGRMYNVSLTYKF